MYFLYISFFNFFIDFSINSIIEWINHLFHLVTFIGMIYFFVYVIVIAKYCFPKKQYFAEIENQYPRGTDATHVSTKEFNQLIQVNIVTMKCSILKDENRLIIAQVERKYWTYIVRNYTDGVRDDIDSLGQICYTFTEAIQILEKLNTITWVPIKSTTFSCFCVDGRNTEKIKSLLKDQFTKNPSHLEDHIQKMMNPGIPYFTIDDNNSSTDKIIDLEEKKLCKICFVNPMNCLLMDCAHLAVCLSCGKKLKQCPICRKNIRRKIKIYTT